MKHIEKPIRYSLEEPDQYLSNGGALSTGTCTFYGKTLPYCVEKFYMQITH